MPGTLLPYDLVPPGLEMAVYDKEARAWGLWWNVTLNDDPAAWDDQMQRLNALQRELGAVSDGHRRVRAHMAEFCRRHPLFPTSIDLLCAEIAAGDLLGGEAGPPRLGCEGRNLLESVGARNASVNARQCVEVTRNYAPAIARWRDGEAPRSPLERRVSGFLGTPTATRIEALEGIVATLYDPEISYTALRAAAVEATVARCGEGALERAPHPVYCLTCDTWTNDTDLCCCAPARVLDAGLLAAGPWGDRQAMSEAFQGYIQEYILAYALALNAWLADRAVPARLWPEGTRFLFAEAMQDVIGRVNRTLGAREDASQAQVWLVGCLLKTVSGNQRWHKRIELIDGVPDATSWLTG
jgi:hypothetical protein